MMCGHTAPWPLHCCDVAGDRGCSFQSRHSCDPLRAPEDVSSRSFLTVAFRCGHAMMFLHSLVSQLRFDTGTRCFFRAISHSCDAVRAPDDVSHFSPLRSLRAPEVVSSQFCLTVAIRCGHPRMFLHNPMMLLHSLRAIQC